MVATRDTDQPGRGTRDGPARGVRVSGLTKLWSGTLAVDNVSFDVGAGEVVAILGPNGAGKSTTIDVVLGLSRADSGVVTVWGMEPAAACRAGHVGALLQTGGLLGAATVRELVGMLRKLSPHPLPLQDILETAQVTDLADRRADRLSGGQTQRVRFAMAIAGCPDLLILDEPTVGMDVSARRHFWAAMRAWTERGRTVLFATHYLEEAEAFADRVVLMAHGRIVADGPVSEVKAAVGGRTIKVVLPDMTDDAISALPGVTNVSRRGDAVSIASTDSDAALRALLAAAPGAHDIEVVSAGLEEAFVALTADNEPGAAS